MFLTGWLGEVKSWLAMRMFGVECVFSPVGGLVMIAGKMGAKRLGSRSLRLCVV